MGQAIPVIGDLTTDLSHDKISRGFVKKRLKITSETKEWQKIILKPK
jgi:hypothetical protein